MDILSIKKGSLKKIKKIIKKNLIPKLKFSYGQIIENLKIF